jgi:hypothetical protein
MGKHRRPGPLDQPSATPGADADNPLAPYEKRRRAPMDEVRRHRPLHGGGSHLKPGEPRILLEWDGFTYVAVGTSPDLATARKWVHDTP